MVAKMSNVPENVMTLDKLDCSKFEYPEGVTCEVPPGGGKQMAEWKLEKWLSDIQVLHRVWFNTGVLVHTEILQNTGNKGWRIAAAGAGWVAVRQ